MAEPKTYTNEEWEEWRGMMMTRAYIDRLKGFKAELSDANATEATSWDVYNVNKGQIMAMNDIIDDIMDIGKEK